MPSKRTGNLQLVADENARRKLETAAESIGLDLEQLANLVADSGLLATPPSDGITQKYTLEDLGKRLWSTMQDMPRKARAEWYHNLVPAQQKAVIVTLRDRGYSSEVIGQELEVDRLEINRIWAKHADELGSQVVGLRLNTIAGQMQLASERAQHMAVEKGDHNAYWRISKETIGLLQSLGIVDQAKHKVEITHKFDDQQKEHIDALAKLRQKQLQQAEDMKLIEAEVQDTDSEPRIEDYDV